MRTTINKFFLDSIIIVLFLVLTITYYFYIHIITHDRIATDFTMFYESAKAFLKGHNIYSAVPWGQYKMPAHVIRNMHHLKKITSLGMHHSTNLNAPLWTLLMIPFGLMSYQTAFWCWSLISILLGAIAFKLVLKAIFPQHQNRFFILSGLTLFFVAVPVYINIGLSEMGLIMLFLLVNAWLLSRRRLDVAAGCILGFALVLKLFVGLFLLFFIFYKRWRLILAFISSFLLLHTIAWLIVGTKNYWTYYHVLHSVSWFSNSWNGSMYGFLTRLFGGSDNIPLYPLKELTPILYFIFSLILVSLLCWMIHIKEKTTASFDLNYAITLVMILLISPLGWLYYFPLLLLPIALVIQFISRHNNKHVITFILATAIFMLCVPFPMIISFDIQPSLLMFTNYAYRFYGLLIMLGLLFYLHSQQQIDVKHQNSNISLLPIYLIWVSLLPSINLLLVNVFR